MHQDMSTKTCLLALACALLVAIALGFATTASAQTSLSDGLYTAEQAQRGAEEYSARCASCHAADLRGNSNSPSLLGLSFLFIWEGRPLGELFAKMRDEMPTDNPGSLSQQSYAAILAYILQQNDYPSGAAELPYNAAALDDIAIAAP